MQIATLVISLISMVAIMASILLFPKIKLGKINISTYWVIALLGAIILICVQSISFNDIGNGLFDNTSSMNPIKILVLFFSMSFISIYLEHAGLFSFLAGYAAKKAKDKQILLFVILYLLISVLTIFTSNDIVILTFTPFIVYFAKHTKINPIPYLVMEFAAANTWSMALLIGNPTNIFISSINNIDFISYFKVMILPTLVAGVFGFILIHLLFRKSLSKPFEPYDEEVKLNNKIDTIVGVVILLTCLVMLVISNHIHLAMWIISLGAMCILLIYFLITSLYRGNFVSSGKEIFKSLPYEVIPFVLSMFIIVLALNKQEISKVFADFLGSSNTIWTYGYSSYLACNLMNNIPMSILYSTLPSNISDITEMNRAIYASIVGSNIGAFLTPIGALAGIMFTTLLKKYDVKYTFKTFTLYGVLISVPTISITLLVLFFII